MADLLAGTTVKSIDFPPTVQGFENTSQLNLSNTTYAAGTPEVGATFFAGTTGRVLITVGGGVRNNGSNADRIFLAPQVFLGTSSAGVEVLAPSSPQYGIGSGGGYTNDAYQYLSREALLEGLSAGQTYYARVMYATDIGSGTCDIAARSILAKPAT